MTVEQEIELFVEQWPDEPGSCRKVFLDLYRFLQGLEQSRVLFHARAGITYSLRAAHHQVSDKELFVMVDVIEDSPRWLSVCFYEQMVTDPESRGDSVPGGLLGEDGLCFDVESDSEEMLDYLKLRIIEAHAACSSPAFPKSPG
jgi:hypothetical protein